MFNDNVLKTIRNREVILGYTNSGWNYDMYDFITYMNTHPEKFKIWEPNNRRLGLIKMESRKSTPDFAKIILNNLRKTFYKNNITCHAFCGFTNYSKSFNIHKDKMDVLYLQVIGDIQWSIWESDLDKSQIDPKQGTCISKYKFTPGNWIWVPRGTYHLVEPIDPRVGFSFGIENNPDPSTYI
jgi:hypothetical protein